MKAKISGLLLIKLIKSEFNLIGTLEHKFCERKYKFDFAIISHKIAIEFEGGVFTNGRHTRGVGYLNDMEKYNLATVHGWRLLRYAHVKYTYKQILDDIDKTLKIL